MRQRNVNSLSEPIKVCRRGLVVLTLICSCSAQTQTATKKKPSLKEEVKELTRAESILRGSSLFSLRQWAGDYQPQLDLLPLFPAKLEAAPSVDWGALAKEWKLVAPRFDKLRVSQAKQEALVRGEMQDPALRKSVEALLQVSLLRLRVLPAQQVALWIETEGATWQGLMVAAAFDDASILGLRAAVDLRFMYWREWLLKVKKSLAMVNAPANSVALPLTEISRHLNAASMVWPVDRVLITESRKTLLPAAQLVANGMGVELQKNPYRSLAEIRGHLRGGNLPGLAALDVVWTSSDVERRKSEEDLFHELLLRVEIARYRQINKSTPTGLEELVQAGFLTRIPLCHSTGKPWVLTQL